MAAVRTDRIAIHITIKYPDTTMYIYRCDVKYCELIFILFLLISLTSLLLFLDPRYDTELMLSGKKVIVPQGRPISTSFTASSFYQSEYLIYRESQTRIRYMIKIKF